jgi:DNA-binding transcriptional LysR family regulator
MNRAAEKLFISQPTLTSAVKELESEVQIQIFQRNSRGIVVTKEGADFLRKARQIYQQYELLHEEYVEKKDFKHKFGVSAQHYSFAVKAFVETVKKYNTTQYEFAIRETKTKEVIEDVANAVSEIGVLFLSDFNRKYIKKMLDGADLEFIPLTECQAYVYLYRQHPLAALPSITFEMLQDYPCLSFEQNNLDALYLAEEILGEREYARTIKTNDRASMLNLMVGLNAYTLCSGIICEELNGSDYVAVPFQEDESNANPIMEIGYIRKKRTILSTVGEVYVQELIAYLSAAAE